MTPTITAIRLLNFTTKNTKDTEKNNKSFVIFVSFVVETCPRYTRRTWVFRFWSVPFAPQGKASRRVIAKDYGEGGTDRFHGRTRKCALGRQVEQDSAACRDNAAMGR